LDRGGLDRIAFIGAVILIYILRLVGGKRFGG
jgi:hypothetical protein